MIPVEAMDLMRFYPIHVENGVVGFVEGEISAYGMAVKELKKVLDDYGNRKGLMMNETDQS